MLETNHKMTRTNAVTNKVRTKEFPIIVSGSRACFSRPEYIVERVSYPLITPSAAKGLFECVHFKPEFQWIVKKIEIINPIQYDSLSLNEVNHEGMFSRNGKTIQNPIEIFSSSGSRRIIRNVKYLKDVCYRIWGCIEADNWDIATKHEQQFFRYLKQGKFFHNPFLGIGDFIGDISEDNENFKPQEMNIHFGKVLHYFVYHKDGKKDPVFFDCVANKGIIEVPEIKTENLDE